MAVITQFPRGLVSLTGLRDNGEAPRNLSEVIAPTIDVKDFLLLNRETIITGDTANVVGAYAPAPGEVPPGELWYVHALCGRSAVLGAGASLRYTVGILQQGRYFAASQRSADATAGQQATASTFAGFWAGPGTQLGFAVEAIAAGPITIDLQFVISRLRI